MRKTGYTLVETLIVITIIAILISISTAGWAVITRGFRDHAILDSAVQGVIYVLTDARGRSVETKIPQWVGIVDTDLFATGATENATDISWTIPREVNVSFEPSSGSFYYVFGAWAIDDNTPNNHYGLLDSATITVTMTNGGRERKIVIQNGLASEL